MKYLFLICVDGPAAEPVDAPEAPEDESDINAWLDDTERRGVRLMGDRLRPPTDATTVRVRDGQVLLTDGPFVETKEMIAGFDVIDCANLDEAIEIASKHPVAQSGMIDVRPFWTE